MIIVCISSSEVALHLRIEFGVYETKPAGSRLLQNQQALSLLCSIDTQFDWVGKKQPTSD
jgi:hypothetical protein